MSIYTTNNYAWVYTCVPQCMYTIHKIHMGGLLGWCTNGAPGWRRTASTLHTSLLPLGLSSVATCFAPPYPSPPCAARSGEKRPAEDPAGNTWIISFRGNSVPKLPSHFAPFGRNLPWKLFLSKFSIDKIHDLGNILPWPVSKTWITSGFTEPFKFVHANATWPGKNTGLSHPAIILPGTPKPVTIFCPEFGPSFPIPLQHLAHHENSFQAIPFGG